MTDSGTLRASWRQVFASPERVLVPTIAFSILAIALHVLLQYLIGITVAGNARCARGSSATFVISHCGPDEHRGGLAAVAGLFVIYVIAHLVVAGMDRVALDVVDGVPVRGPFRGWNVLRALPTALLLGAVLTVATFLFLLPALVLGFFTRYAMLVVVDRQVGPFAAIRASLELVGARAGSELWFVLRAVGVLLLGILALGVGLYLAIPVVLLAQAARYRTASPAAVAP